ncbi:MAG: hypothetical protein OSJ37_00035 [Muribaculaceae bacterium]|jgi:hypothetical protein|nr:hypothetical protein [Muribaculaceae bacterium]
MKVLFAILLGFGVGYMLAPRPKAVAPDVKVLTRVDTLRVTVPEIVVVRAKESVCERLALASDTTDSVEVHVPLTQTVYRGDAYRAVLSGHMAVLDTIEIFQQHSTLVCTKTVRRRVSIGLQGGYGLTPKGFQPYIGVGVSVRIL